MGCVNCDCEGVCDLYDANGGGIDAGYDDNGFCVCCDDPDPTYSCSGYESDYVCDECGADLNVEECECG